MHANTHSFIHSSSWSSDHTQLSTSDVWGTTLIFQIWAIALQQRRKRNKFEKARSKKKGSDYLPCLCLSCLPPMCFLSRQSESPKLPPLYTFPAQLTMWLSTTSSLFGKMHGEWCRVAGDQSVKLLYLALGESVCPRKALRTPQPIPLLMNYNSMHVVFKYQFFFSCSDWSNNVTISLFSGEKKTGCKGLLFDWCLYSKQNWNRWHKAMWGLKSFWMLGNKSPEYLQAVTPVCSLNRNPGRLK